MQHGTSSFLADCPSRLTMEILSDKWSALVIFGLREGPTRHKALIDRIGGVSRKVLTDTLRKLQDYGLVERTEDSARHIDYRLTELGQSLLEPIEMLNDWASEYGAAIEDHRKIRRTQSAKASIDGAARPFSQEL